MITIIVKTIALAARLAAFAPSYVDTPHAIAHAFAAELAATPDVPAEVLLGAAYIESRYDATATSCVVLGRRVGRRAASRSQAGKGPRFCGVLQTIAGDDWATCLAQRPLLVGYQTGADELAQWMRYAGRDLQRALDGHGCGVSGMRNGCRNYGARVLAVARRLGWTNRRVGT